MHESLTIEQKLNLIEMIVETEGYQLPYLDFTVELGDLIENIPGLELINGSKYDDFVVELWELYTKQKIEHYTQDGKLFVDL